MPSLYYDEPLPLWNACSPLRRPPGWSRGRIGDKPPPMSCRSNCAGSDRRAERVAGESNNEKIVAPLHLFSSCRHSRLRAPRCAFPHRSLPATAPSACSAVARRAARQSGGHRGPGLDLHCSQALRPPSIDRLLSRENCVSLGACNRAFQWFGRCVSYPSPLASANGNFDLVPDAAVLHELGAPLGSISPCAAPVVQAGQGSATALFYGSACRFRTIQVCPKDRRVLPRHPDSAVCWHTGSGGSPCSI